MPHPIITYPTAEELGELFAARFWSRLNKTDSCWLWTMATDGKGYGVVTFGSRLLLAHRVAYALTHGSIPDQFALHQCDNSPCCNPAHIHLGTHSENLKEAADRNRLTIRRGEANVNAKLTQQQADEMRVLFAAGEMNKSQLSRRYGVSCPIVRRILSGKAYPPDAATAKAVVEAFETSKQQGAA